MRITIVGTGRAGSAFSLALRRAGHAVTLVHHDELEGIEGSDLVLLAVPDDALAEVAALIPPSPERVLAHLAGSRGLSVLAPHPRVASVHPLVTMPTPERGAARLVGASFAVSGDELAVSLADSLGGRVIRVPDERRAAYHATAAVAANHLVALMGHVEALADAAGLRLADFLALSEMALDDVRELGPERALTGPAARGDMATIDAHLAAIPESQRATYVALVNAAFELAERRRSQTLA
ncbi:MAG TPA: DUF2520 domain-containing protein [Acidimicrobiales bacterium]|nr:DUF2520 domain-containing protein [Acidimicrobiales bacterium]